MPELECNRTLVRMYFESEDIILKYTTEYKKLARQVFLSEQDYAISNKRCKYLRDMINIHKERKRRAGLEFNQRQKTLRGVV